MTPHLPRLPPEALRSLALSLRSGPLSHGPSQGGIESIAGRNAVEVRAWLEAMWAVGFTPAQMAVVVGQIQDERERAGDPLQFLDLVLSGPKVSAIPVRTTEAVFDSLIAGAHSELLVTGYAVHDGRRLFEGLARRMNENHGLRVSMVIDFKRYGDTTTAPEELSLRLTREFWAKHWPSSDRKPRLAYDPRSLAKEPDSRAVMHAKVVVADRSAALVTSANLTPRAQQENIELGVLVKHPPLAQRIADYFDALIAQGQLATVSPPQAR